MKLFRKKIEPRCAYCEKGAALGDTQVACVKKGVMNSEDHCSHFSYDPLKRVPPRPVTLEKEKLHSEDFAL